MRNWTLSSKTFSLTDLRWCVFLIILFLLRLFSIVNNKKYLLVFFLCLASVSLSARVTSDFSFTTSYLPTRFPLWDYYAAEWKSTTVNGYGVGLEYNLTVPLLQSRWVFRTGIGCTYSRIDVSVDKTEFYFNAPFNSTNIIRSLIIANTICETQREYIYAYFPIGIGYKLYSKGKTSVIPFVGLQGKYNIAFTERGCVQSFTWRDHYFELFDENNVKSEAERFIVQLSVGMAVKYKNLSLSLSYARDEKRMYKEAYILSCNRAYWGPYSFNCLQLGVGINF